MATFVFKMKMGLVIKNIDNVVLMRFFRLNVIFCILNLQRIGNFDAVIGENKSLKY